LLYACSPWPEGEPGAKTPSGGPFKI